MTTEAEQILQEASQSGSMDYSKWPEILTYILPALDHIVHHEFPIPRIPITLQAPSSPIQGRNETDASASTPVRSPKVIPATPQNSSASAANTTATPEQQPNSPSVVPNSQPPAATPDIPSSSNNHTGQVVGSVSSPEGSLPPQILALYNGIIAMLKGQFGRLPPYTLQRLSELILQPRGHYNTLPAYLRALDKTLNVASTADVYPLPVPPESNPQESGSYLSQPNGAGHRPRDDGFNGAELTRIPWIRESAESDGELDAPGEPVEGITAAGPGAIDQPERMLLSDANEALRERERRTSPNTAPGIIEGALATPATANRSGDKSEHTAEAGAGVPETEITEANATERETILAERQVRGEDADRGDAEMATARGPEEIGNEDIGPQRSVGAGMPGIVDLEAAVGRPGEGEIVSGSNVQVPEERRAASEETTSAELEDKGEEMAVDEPEKKDD